MCILKCIEPISFNPCINFYPSVRWYMLHAYVCGCYSTAFASSHLIYSFGNFALYLYVKILERKDSLPSQKKVSLQWLLAVVTVMLKCVAWHQSEKAAALW
jgi:hypothetical protein